MAQNPNIQELIHNTGRGNIAGRFWPYNFGDIGKFGDIGTFGDVETDLIGSVGISDLLFKNLELLNTFINKMFIKYSK